MAEYVKVSDLDLWAMGDAYQAMHDRESIWDLGDQGAQDVVADMRDLLEAALDGVPTVELSEQEQVPWLVMQDGEPTVAIAHRRLVGPWEKVGNE